MFKCQNQDCGKEYENTEGLEGAKLTSEIIPPGGRKTEEEVWYCSEKDCSGVVVDVD